MLIFVSVDTNFIYSGGRGHLDIQSQWVSAVAWPEHKGMFEGALGLSTEYLLVGRTDGSLAVVEIIGQSTFRRKELEHCRRSEGEIKVQSNKFLF